MDAFDGSLSDIDGEEFQATQLLQAALIQSPERSGRNRNPIQAEADITINSSSSNSNASNSTTAHYHFHGLASTQIDTQISDDTKTSSDVPGKDFNNVTGGRLGKDTKSKWTMPSPPSRPSSPPSLASKKNATMGILNGLSGQSPTRVAQSKSFPSRNPTTTTLSPSKKSSTMLNRTGPQTTVSKRNLRGQETSRAQSLDSQDSFVQDDIQLSKGNILLTSRKFTMPLSDLARGVGTSEGTFSPGPNRRSEVTKSAYFPRAVSRPPPVILVPSTPSASESSQNSYEEVATQLDEESFGQAQDSNRMIPDNDSNKGSSQNSQGYDGQDEVAEVQDLYSPKPSTLVPAHTHFRASINNAVQVQEPTQIISTQVDTLDSIEVNPSLVPPTDSTAPYIGPRSLLYNLDRQKQNRYLHLLKNQQASAATPITPVSPQPTFPQFTSNPKQYPAGFPTTTEYEETQVSDIVEESVSTSNINPAPSKPSPVNVIQRPTLTPSISDEIIPDSEPLRELATGSSTTRTLCVARSKSPQGQKTEQIKGDLSKDSETVDEDSDFPPPRVLQREEEEEEEEEEEAEEGNRNDDKDEANGPMGKDKGKGKATEQTEDSTDDSDDDSDEDNVPLSARLRKGKQPGAGTRGKKVIQTYTSKAKNTRKATGSRVPPTSNKPQRTQKLPSKPTIIDTTHENTIPSSVPGEGNTRSLRTRKPSAKAVIAAKEKSKQPVRKRSTRATSEATRSHRSATVETENENDVDDDENIMDVVPDSEKETEPADDEEDDYLKPELPTTNKRKRGQPPTSKSLNLVTPQTRNTKRLKSGGSTMARMDATRVLAYWKKNGLWYSGYVSEKISPTDYLVQFDDGYDDIVSIDKMRILDIREGDCVRIDKKPRDYRVLKVNRRTMVITVDVEGTNLDVNLSLVAISTKIINSMWRDRTLDSRTIVPGLRNSNIKSTPSPSLSAPSLLSMTSTKATSSRPLAKLLNRVGLIVSLCGSSNNDKTKDGHSRNEILRTVRDVGGLVVEDLTKYLKMDITKQSQRWMIEENDTQWVGDSKEIERLFLLADDYNSKPKYLMALALGIPCLSVRWLYDCLSEGKELEWSRYLLPQGCPSSYNVIPSQQVDLNWGMEQTHLSDIMENPIASKILSGKNVLCVGTDMMPSTTDSASYIIRIILAMGARRVEAVAHLENARLSKYDLLVIREKEQYSAEYVHTNTVDWNWVKDSLIMSRLLEYPIWGLEEEDSQCSQCL